MGVKATYGPKGKEFIEWFPQSLYKFHLTSEQIAEEHRKNKQAGLKGVGVCVSQRIYPSVFTKPFSYLNWFLFRQSFAIYVCLLLSISSAWALTGPELDALQTKIIAAESSGNPQAIGDNGKARGLMQIHKATWKRYTKDPWSEAFNPEKNRQTGRAILEDLNRMLGKQADEKHIVFAYNTGRLRFGALPDWTKKHPNRIYREIFNK